MKCKALEIKSKIPEDMQEMIDAYIDHMNNGNGLLADIYQVELSLMIRDYKDCFTSDEVEALKKYYARSGMLKAGSGNVDKTDELHR